MFHIFSIQSILAMHAFLSRLPCCVFFLNFPFRQFNARTFLHWIFHFFNNLPLRDPWTLQRWPEPVWIRPSWLRSAVIFNIITTIHNQHTSRWFLVRGNWLHRPASIDQRSSKKTWSRAGINKRGHDSKKILYRAHRRQRQYWNV